MFTYLKQNITNFIDTFKENYCSYEQSKSENIITPKYISKKFTGVDYIYTNDEKYVIFFFSNGRHNFGVNIYLKVPINDLQNIKNYKYSIIDKFPGSYTWVSVKKDSYYYYALFSGGNTHNKDNTITQSKLYKFNLEMNVIETYTYKMQLPARYCLLYDLGVLNGKSKDGILNCIIVGTNGVSIFNYNEQDNLLFNILPSKSDNRYLGILPYPFKNPQYLIIGQRTDGYELKKNAPNIVVNLKTFQVMESLKFCDVSTVSISLISKKQDTSSLLKKDTFDYIITGNSQGKMITIPDYTWKIVKNKENKITNITPYNLIKNMDNYKEPQDSNFINNTATRIISSFYLDDNSYPYNLVICEGTQSFILIPKKHTSEPYYDTIYKLDNTQFMRSRGGIVITDKNNIYIIIAVYDSDNIYFKIPRFDLLNKSVPL